MYPPLKCHGGHTERPLRAAPRTQNTHSHTCSAHALARAHTYAGRTHARALARIHTNRLCGARFAQQSTRRTRRMLARSHACTLDRSRTRKTPSPLSPSPSPCTGAIIRVYACTLRVCRSACVRCHSMAGQLVAVRVRARVCSAIGPATIIDVPLVLVDGHDARPNAYGLSARIDIFC